MRISKKFQLLNITLLYSCGNVYPKTTLIPNGIIKPLPGVTSYISLQYFKKSTKQHTYNLHNKSNDYIQRQPNFSMGNYATNHDLL